MTKTKWFSVKTPPSRTGWYEGRFGRNDSMQRRYWYQANENTWLIADLDGLLINALFGNVWKDTEQWRGLTEKYRD